VATVQALDANGNVLDSTPVENNLFRLDHRPAGRSRRGDPTLGANGSITATEQLPTATQPTNKPPNPGRPTNK
jgi:hypothetical protein